MIGKSSADLQGMLKAAGYRSGPRRRQWPGPGIACPFFMHFFLHFLIFSAAAMVLAAALIAPQPLFDVDHGLIGAFIGVGRHSLGFE